MKAAFMKSFNPKVAIKVVSLDDKSVENLLHELYVFMQKNHNVVLDDKKDTIYLAR